MNIKDLLGTRFVGLAVTLSTFGLIHAAVGQVRSLGLDEIFARLPLLTAVDFEGLSPNVRTVPLRVGGITFNSYKLTNCQSCALDPGDTGGGNILVSLKEGDTMVFSRLPRFVVWDIRAGGAGPFTFNVIDGRGSRHVMGHPGASPPSFFGVESTYGVRQVQVADFQPDGGTGRLAFARILLHDVPPPANLVAKSVWSTQINLTWKYNRDDHDSFQVERSAGSRNNYVGIVTLPPEETFFEDIGLARNTRYFYRVRATHPNGESAYSNDASAGTGGPETNVVFRAIAAEDGYVCERWEFLNLGEVVIANGAGGDALVVGDLGGDQQCKAFLSFDTSVIPDGAQIVSATLFLREGPRNGRPFDTLGPLFLDIAGGRGFGNWPGLQATDFADFPDAQAIARIPSAPAEGDWHVINLSRSARSHISKTGRTQFRLYFAIDDNDNATPDNVGFYSGNSSNRDNRPTLEIIYQRP